VPHPLSRAERLGVLDLREQALIDRLTALFDEVWAEARPL